MPGRDKRGTYRVLTCRTPRRHILKPMTRRARIFTALIAIASLLAVQFAVSAYACVSMAQQMSASDATGSACEDLQYANLCQQHCQFGKVSFETAKPAPTDDVIQSSVLRIAAPQLLAHSMRILLRRAPLPPERPPAIRFSVLRI